MEFEGRKKINTAINIAPLIDTIFLLLLFFMLSSHFVTEPGIKISLPESVTALPQKEDDIIVFISEDNSLYFEGKPVTEKAFRDVIARKLKSADKKSVIIKADEKADLGPAVRVMDMVKQAGGESLVISTKMKAVK